MRKLLLLSLAVLALAAGTASGMTTSTKTYIDSCGKKALHPAKIVITCADANYYLQSLKWHHWGKRKATATGVAWVNDCKPNCSAGKFKSYPITAKTYRRRACKGHRVYRRLAVTYTHAAPKGIPNPDVIKLGCV
jgi:hypothetical protein